jgi:hypothetical protein
MDGLMYKLLASKLYGWPHVVVMRRLDSTLKTEPLMKPTLLPALHG